MKQTLVALSVLLSGAVMAKAPLTVEHLNQFNKLHDVVLSPDGRFLVYGQTNGGFSPADTSSDLYLMDLSNLNKVTRITQSAGRESQLQWANDGQSIYFIANRSGTNQVWQLPLYGGEALQITDLPLPVEGFKVSANNKQLALALSVKPGCQNLQCTLDAKAADAAKKDTAMAYDQLMVRHWDSWLTPYRSHLHIAELGKGTVKNAVNLMSEWNTDIAGINEVAFTPDNESLVFSAKIPAEDQAWHTNYDIFKVPVSGGEKQNMTEANPAWDAQPSFSADGRFMAYKAMSKPQAEADKFSLILLDMVTGQRNELAPEFDRSISDYKFGPDNRTIYVTTQDVGQYSIYAINTSFGDVRKVHGDGTAGALNVASDKIVFTNHKLDMPPEVFQLSTDGGSLTQLTDINANWRKAVQFGDYEQFSFKGANDATVYGYLVKPWDFDAKKKYPMAFLVHGGPQGSFGNMFNERWNAQMYAAKGYAVVMVDFHGSTGYGQAFTDSISRDWGGKPLEDLKKGFDYIVQAQPWIDANRACALGASYGGYMMNWIAGNWPTGFKCLVNHAGLYDMPSFYGSTEELWFPEFDLGGPVWQAESDYQKFNPAALADKWQTPMLVIHGLKDYRVPYAQGLGAFTNLQRKGIDSRLVIFPDENHWILNKDNRVRWYNEVFQWLDKYTKG
ncbi:Dipeptidyl aminopeptidase/acylaminoacyl peptidase [Rheinheimera pacifica]|uniref:Dipeptidyl aminopeptidase/acylaminoacyl peptidase n=1 Tax=Rheinheimera pacifica TaxID=173990 RepID=A0A1H6NA32_9GAMM|nr:S9 family peptidase [Rheinheimera pacifica]SEI11708.1 Dipeptidyl aminopeptidase/acylaminoacyl peptidase [Rheinheimera pacifica]